MSRLSNLTTVKIGIFKSWNASWYDKTYYASLLFNDLKIRDYISGLFYRLKIVSDYIYLYRLLNNNIIIKTNLIFFSNLKFKTITLKKVYHLNEHFLFFYKKKTWRRFLFNFKIFFYFKYQQQNLLPICNSSSLLATFSNSFAQFFYSLSFFANNISSFLNIYTPLFNLSSIVLKSISMYNSSFLSLFLNVNFTSYTLFSSLVLPFFLGSYVFNDMGYLFSNWFYFSYFSLIRAQFILFFKYFYYFIFTVNGFTTLSIPMISVIPFFQKINTIHDLNLSADIISFNLMCYSRRDITQSLFTIFRSKIEATISFFEQQNIYLSMSISFKKNPFIVSAKLITDALVFLLESGKKIVQSFFFIKNWQASLYASRRRLEYLSYQYSSKRVLNLNYLFFYATKRSPVIGIRIECSGTFKKGRMSKVYFYNSWVKNDLLTGKMPNNTLIADIDYYQYFAITKGSSIGIKTWIFLETHIYNNNHKYISLVY
jgi:hypothetical protein